MLRAENAIVLSSSSPFLYKTLLPVANWSVGLHSAAMGLLWSAKAAAKDISGLGGQPGSGLFEHLKASSTRTVTLLRCCEPGALAGKEWSAGRQ